MNFECNHNETREIFDGKFIVIIEQSGEISSLNMDQKKSNSTQTQKKSITKVDKEKYLLFFLP